MKSRIKLCLKTAWLTAAVVVLFMGTDLCISTDKTCFDAGESMIVLMALLSFPAGVLFVSASAIFLELGSVHYPSDYITIWLIMTCGGYLQWFIVGPRLVAKQDFTLLSLREANLPSTLSTGDARPTRNQRPKQIKPVSAFDKQGRTPLERALAERL